MSDKSKEELLENGQPAAAPEGERPEVEPAGELSELERLQNDYAALNERHLRLAAEYDNFRKRTQREREAAWTDATAAAATAFLSVVDNFERAVESPCADAEYKKGVELTFKSLTEALERLHVVAFGEAGEAFDPERHNAVMHVEEEGAEASAVTEVFQKGYKMGDRVLRYAMVKVAN